MTKTLIIALATSTLAVGTAAAAQERTGPMAEVTRADAEARAAQAFARMDANADGVLNAADREAQARARFDAADANHDGALTFEELHAAHQQRRAEMGERGGEPGAERGEGRRGGERMARRGEGHGEGHGMRQGRRGGMHGALLRQADSDNDGAISQAEFTTAMLARFDGADADNNGVVTAEERRARHGERRQRMQERRATRG